MDRHPYKTIITRGLANLALCVASVLVTIAAVEISLRYTAYGRQFQSMDAYGFWPRYYHKPDPINGHDITPNFPPVELKFRDYFEAFGADFTVSSNELGCRDNRMEQESRYILLLGDSFAWGVVPLQDTFGATIERLIGERVLKCGVCGYGPRHVLHKLEQVVDQVGPPSTVILGYYVGNDLIDDYLFPKLTVLDGYVLGKIGFLQNENSDTNTVGERRVYSDEDLQKQLRKHLEYQEATFALNVKKFMARHSIVYNVMRNSGGIKELASRLGLADPPPPSSLRKPYVSPVFHSLDDVAWLEKAWKQHTDNLMALKHATDELNARLLIVLIPTREQVYDYLRPPGETYDWEYPNRRLTEFLENEGVSVLDLLPELKNYANLQPKKKLDPREDLYWPDDDHLNVKGNRVVGLLISHHLLEGTFLDGDEKSKRLFDINEQLRTSSDYRL